MQSMKTGLFVRLFFAIFSRADFILSVAGQGENSSPIRLEFKQMSSRPLSRSLEDVLSPPKRKLTVLGFPELNRLDS